VDLEGSLSLVSRSPIFKQKVQACSHFPPRPFSALKFGRHVGAIPNRGHGHSGVFFHVHLQRCKMAGAVWAIPYDLEGPAVIRRALLDTFSRSTAVPIFAESSHHNSPDSSWSAIAASKAAELILRWRHQTVDELQRGVVRRMRELVARKFPMTSLPDCARGSRSHFSRGI
jgi:hypothetical protein